MLALFFVCKLGIKYTAILPKVKDTLVQNYYLFYVGTYNYVRVQGSDVHFT